MHGGPSVVDLLRFVHELREDFFETVATLGPKEFTKDRGTSMHSFRQVFLHLATVEEHHVTAFCEGEPREWPGSVMAIPRDQYTTIPQVRRRLRAVTAIADAKYRRWNAPSALETPVVWVSSGKYPIRLTRGNALAQCATEQLLHLGEVEAMLWQLDVAPPSTFWIYRRVLGYRWPPPRSALWPGTRIVPFSEKQPAMKVGRTPRGMRKTLGKRGRSSAS